MLCAGQELGVEGDHGAGHLGVPGVIRVDLVDGEPVLVTVDRSGQGVGGRQAQGSGTLMDETVDGLEARTDLQGGEVGRDNDRGAPQPGGEEGEVMVDGLLDQLALGGEEGASFRPRLMVTTSGSQRRTASNQVVSRQDGER